MCGIAGFYNESPHATPDDHVRNVLDMMAALRHRGPDQGAYVTYKNQGEVGGGGAIGHTRMKVRGSDEITQPIVSGSRITVVNGEFYNDTVRWNRTDSELCMVLPPRELIGEFAYASYNHRTNETVLVRDRFGVKPLYYYWRKGVYAYASEAKALLKYPAVEKDLDPNAECRLFVNMVVPNTTMWTHIHAVPPGCKVTLSPHYPPKIEQYWDVPVDQDQRPFDNKHRNDIRDILCDAISKRVNDTNVMCYVSGGMDGQIVHELAKSMYPSRVDSMTCDFGDGDKYDQARHVIAFSGHTQHVQAMQTLAIQAERTIYNPIGVAKMEMARRSKELGFNAVMGGQGADELFAGYQFFNYEPWAGLSKPMYADGAPIDSPKHDAWEQIFGFTPQFLYPWIKLWKASIYYETRDKYDPFAVVAQMFSDKVYLDHLTLQQYIWIKTHFVDQILTWGGDRPEMMYAIEGRIPFLDLADVAFSILPADRRNKKPLREIYNYPVSSHPKKSFMYPYSVRSIGPISDPLTINGGAEKNSQYLTKLITGPLADTAHWQTQTLRALQGHKY